ncbi:MAG: amidohydrolase [Leptospira sp.]|nr:amidohydrolase [Leptospira sp.]
MPTIKISLYQKDLHKKFSNDQIQKIASQRANFLLLPEGFPHFFKASSNNQAANHEKEYQDHLLEISEVYQGVIMGGSHYRKNAEGKLVSSSPIVQSLVIVDFYDKKNLSHSEKDLQKGDTESIFIMGGLRFGILIGEDINDKSIWEEFKKEEIEVIFHLSGENSGRTYEEDLDYFSNLSKETKTHIIRVCGLTEGKPARSLYASPSGINWKVGKSEEETEVFKTLSVTVRGNFFL